jgi:hypothetical protein
MDRAWLVLTSRWNGAETGRWSLTVEHKCVCVLSSSWASLAGLVKTQRVCGPAVWFWCCDRVGVCCAGSAPQQLRLLLLLPLLLLPAPLAPHPSPSSPHHSPLQGAALQSLSCWLLYAPSTPPPQLGQWKAPYTLYCLTGGLVGQCFKHGAVTHCESTRQYSCGANRCLYACVVVTVRSSCALGAQRGLGVQGAPSRLCYSPAPHPCAPCCRSIS